MTRGFELYQTWNNWLMNIPALQETQNGRIARAIIVTNGKLDEVEFITGATKTEIFQVYQWATEKNLLHSLTSYQQETHTFNEAEMKEMTQEANTSTKVRTFTREEMVDYLKKKLSAANPGIKFIKLKHSTLTCEFNNEQFKVYISTSRDYEPTRKDLDYNAYRVSAWNNGDQKKFSSCDYYAMLVKVDTNTKYETRSNEDIEGIFLNQAELNQWFSQKVSVPSGMINCYVHFMQKEAEGPPSTTVIDAREPNPIPLDELYAKGYTLR